MESFQGIFTGFTDFIGGIFTLDFERAFSGLGSIVDNLANVFNNLIEPLRHRFPNVFNFLSGVIENFRMTAHNIIGNMQTIFTGFTDFFKGIFTLDFNLALEGLGTILEGGLALISNLFLGAFNNILVFFEMLIAPLEERFPFVFGIISDAIGIFRDTVTGVIEGIKQAFSGVIDFIAGVFTGDWERAWDGVVNIFGGIFGSLGSLVKAPINAVISIVNRAISGINSISVDIPEWVPFVGGKNFGVSIPEIPMLAKGTNFHKGGPAIVGEEGPELVMLPRGAKVIPNNESMGMLRDWQGDRQSQLELAALMGKTPRPIKDNNKKSNSNSSMKSIGSFGRRNKPQGKDGYNVNKFDDGNSYNSSKSASTPNIDITIQNLNVNGEMNETTYTNLTERLKETFREVFGELWEDEFYNLSLAYPNITEY